MLRSIAPYGWAAGAVALAAIARWLLDPVLGSELPFLTFYLATILAAWLGGLKPGLVSLALGFLFGDFCFADPRFSFQLGDAVHQFDSLRFIVVGVCVSSICEALHRQRRHVEAQAEFVRVTLASIGDAVITTDNAGRITYLNAVAESLTGWLHREAVGQPLATVFHIVNESTRQPVESPATQALRKGIVVGLANHTILLRKDGRECAIDDSAAPIRDEQGRVSGCVLIFRDVTSRRNLEQDQASRLLAARVLASIVESSDDAIISKSLEGVIQSWNSAAERLFGHAAQQAVGRHISLVIPEERRSEEDHIIARLKAGERIDHFETERMRSDGRRIQVSLTISPVKDDAGQVIGASKIVRDVTERKQSEEERQKFVTLVENSTDFIGICDVQGRPFFVNRAGLAMVGMGSIEEARGKHVRDFFFPEDQAKIDHEFFPNVLDQGHGEVEVRFRHFQTGEPLWMVYKVLKLTNATGQTIGFATVSQNVTERRRMEDDLRQMADDLAQADRRKDEFLATLAHELRNPLAPLRHTLEFLKQTSGDAQTLQQARDTMERQLGQMIRLVDDLLDLSRITRDRLELRMDQVKLATILHQAVEACKPLAEQAGHVLHVALPSEPVYLHADPVRLAQVFSNLLNNSCKYTPPGGQIWLRAERQGSDVAVTVKDTGTGIPAGKLESIFEMFTQIDRSLERSQGGLGIGLTLVKRLVQMHGGSISARSEGEGRGSEFEVRLPVVLRPALEKSPESTAPSRPSSRRRILIVDDNRDAAISLGMLLKLAGNETHTTYDGEAALDEVERLHPEVVLLDIGLPKLNGYEVCRRLREGQAGKCLVLVALTGWGQEEDRRKSHEAGFDGHLVKPVDLAQLTRLLNSLVPGGQPS